MIFNCRYSFHCTANPILCCQYFEVLSERFGVIFQTTKAVEVHKNQYSSKEVVGKLISERSVGFIFDPIR